MWYTALKNLSKWFNTILGNYEAAPLDWLLEHYGYCIQESRGVIRSVQGNST